MKSRLLMLAGTVLAAATFGSVVYAGSHLSGYGKPHEFAHLSNPLWTFEPTYVTRGNVRIGDIAMRAVPDTDASTASQVAATIPASETREAVDHVLDSAHVDWCMTQYRSYRIEDDSYQPYDGGRRKCVSPHEDMNGGTGLTAAAEVPGEFAANAADSHVQWCRLQYRSYRASDNTYQPYSGPRRSCIPDFGI
ncbi:MULTISPECIES: BA14K family protein [unclassified Rhizobium]|uniref:BA14K family protein n=1 Tax=unclassified Rhizobium TaxID=2613769 RepID=UPI00071323E3|nr:MULTISPECIES: BA14K family protein [unclassified Rhizobium]KQS87725.1 hypothetical protein ASG42_20145 [Rhizobium sp. Leaf391]KQT07161.1 hypothetical protein ASG50_01690 [Rhizobium sp. Leaf386]KQT95287.1 hypothetical protein ASG68_14955 [Rhizobium sp. Leaf453]